MSYYGPESRGQQVFAAVGYAVGFAGLITAVSSTFSDDVGRGQALVLFMVLVPGSLAGIVARARRRRLELHRRPNREGLSTDGPRRASLKARLWKQSSTTR